MTYSVAGGLGFEPRQAESESAVLPLDDPPKPGPGEPSGVAGARVIAAGPGICKRALAIRDLLPIVRLSRANPGFARRRAAPCFTRVRDLLHSSPTEVQIIGLKSAAAPLSAVVMPGPGETF